MALLTSAGYAPTVDPDGIWLKESLLQGASPRPNVVVALYCSNNRPDTLVVNVWYNTPGREDEDSMAFGNRKDKLYTIPMVDNIMINEETKAVSFVGVMSDGLSTWQRTITVYTAQGMLEKRDKPLQPVAEPIEGLEEGV